MSQSQSKVTFDHDEIRRWAEERHAKPACVKGTGGEGDTGMLRLDFPGYDAPSLQHISWEDWFDKFDERNLALLYQEKTAEGQKSNFNKLVSRETAEGAEEYGHSKRVGAAAQKQSGESKPRHQERADAVHERAGKKSKAAHKYA